MRSTHHEIEITVSGTRVLPPARIPDLDVGDTVHYFFAGAGKVRITFPGASPFRTDQQTNTKVTGDETLTVKQSGKFASGCQIELPDGTTIGWDPGDPQGTSESGGDHNVRRPP